MNPVTNDFLRVMAECDAAAERHLEMEADLSGNAAELIVAKPDTLNPC